jgi:hypothetical protein
MGWAMADRRSSCAKKEFKSVLNKTAANIKLRLTMINTRKFTPKLRQLSRRCDFFMAAVGMMGHL